MISRLLPASVADRSGWASDLYSVFKAQSIEVTPEHVCAVVAVTEQESGFQVNPVVPGLGVKAWKEIDERAEQHSVPKFVVHGALAVKSPNGRTYSERIDSARTEKDLSDIFEDFIGSVPLGHRLFEGLNPIRTRGPMQVNIAFATSSAAPRSYPFPVKSTLAQELFTRRGSLYYGTAHLLGYAAPYDQYLYRFADFNAGQYASVDAGFQKALARASGVRLVADGALVQGPGGDKTIGDTELAARKLMSKLRMDQGDIRDDLEKGRTAQFEKTDLYRRVFELAEKKSERPVPPAVVPEIKLHGPKISRSLTTDWYAHRVDGRFKRCLQK
ncbi:MAG TPA: DUF1615 domain-containing protein [Steroidobacteraceae bacterium]|jgi:hypothetical protein